MKKLLVVLVSLSLISNGSLYSMTKIKESFKKTRKHWQCITKPKKNKCTPEERKKARKWLIYTPTAIVVSLLFAAGIVATGAYVAKKKGEGPQTAEKEKYEAEKKVGEKEEIEKLVAQTVDKFWPALPNALAERPIQVKKIEKLEKALKPEFQKIKNAVDKAKINSKTIDWYPQLESLYNDLVFVIRKAKEKEAKKI